MNYCLQTITQTLDRSNCWISPSSLTTIYQPILTLFQNRYVQPGGGSMQNSPDIVCSSLWISDFLAHSMSGLGESSTCLHQTSGLTHFCTGVGFFFGDIYNLKRREKDLWSQTKWA